MLSQARPQNTITLPPCATPHALRVRERRAMAVPKSRPERGAWRLNWSDPAQSRKDPRQATWGVLQRGAARRGLDALPVARTDAHGQPRPSGSTAEGHVRAPSMVVTHTITG
eukprot:6974466-Prymnesium_polylepis.1